MEFKCCADHCSQGCNCYQGICPFPKTNGVHINELFSNDAATQPINAIKKAISKPNNTNCILKCAESAF